MKNKIFITLLLIIILSFSFISCDKQPIATTTIKTAEVAITTIQETITTELITTTETTKPSEVTTNKNPSSQNNINISSLMGGIIIADDETYLGKISDNKFDSDSIANEFGDYGSKFSSVSIMNEFGDYGSQFSSYSPFNEFTSTPPKIYLNEKFIGYLTVNKFLTPSVDPVTLIAILTK